MISLTNINKNYGLGPVLEGFSMVVHSGERVGLIGANGSGKSTICKLIMGVEKPDSGEIAIGRNMQIGYLEQIPTRHEGETVEERLKEGIAHLRQIEERLRKLEGLMSIEDVSPNQLERYMAEYGKLSSQFEQGGGYSYESRMAQVIQGLGLDVPNDSMITNLSGGEMARLQLAVLLLKKPEVLLLDEPTNHLDFSAIQWLENYVKNYEGTVLIISHDRYFLDQTIQRIIEVKQGKMEEYPGSYSYYLEERERRHELAQKQYNNQQKEIKRKEAAIKRLRQWANQADNEFLHKRAASMEKQLEKMEKVDRPIDNDPRYKLKFSGDRSGKQVLVLEGVTKGYDGNLLLKGVDLRIGYGQRIGMIGPNGSGKSTLIKMICGEIEPDQGIVRQGANLQIGYFDQHQELIDEEPTVLEGFRLDAPPMSETAARGILARYGFVGNEVFKQIKELSGGERSRYILLKMVYSQVNLLILDEPTNHLDLKSIEILEEALQDYPGTLLVVSHDRYFLNRIVEEIYAIENHQFAYYPGNYDYYQRKVQERKEQLFAIEEQKIKKNKYNAPQRNQDSLRMQEKERQRQVRQLQKKLTDLEAEIAILETKLKENNQKMIQLENLENFQYLQELHEENQETQVQLDQSLTQWTEICDELEGMEIV